MQVGVDQGYMPIQPIHYSHKILLVQIKSNVNIVIHLQEFQNILEYLIKCMHELHQNIAEYNGEEDLENGYTKDFYTKEIKKLYAAVGGMKKIKSIQVNPNQLSGFVFTTFLTLYILIMPNMFRLGK